jgi:hypothetical protein
VIPRARRGGWSKIERVKRRILQLLFTIGVLLTLMVAVLWVRGLWRTDLWSIGRGGVGGDGFSWEGFSIFGGGNVLMVSYHRGHLPAGVPHPPPYGPIVAHQSSAELPISLASRSRGSFWYRVGFWYSSGTDRGGLYQWKLGVPLWFAFVLCAAPTLVSGRSLWHRHRARVRTVRGLCPACAYDLRGVAHERCPECGAIVTGQSAPAQGSSVSPSLEERRGDS